MSTDKTRRAERKRERSRGREKQGERDRERVRRTIQTHGGPNAFILMRLKGQVRTALEGGRGGVGGTGGRGGLRTNTKQS